MAMNINLKILLFFAFVLTSCVPQVAPNGPVVKHQETPIQKPEPTNTIKPSPPATTTVTVTASPSSRLQKNCVSVSSAFDVKAIDGTAVFLDHLGQSIVLMGENNLRIPENFEGNPKNSEQSVSPDGNLLIYRQSKYKTAQSKIVIVTSNGQVVHDFPDQDSWVLGVAWLSDEYIRYPIQSQTNSEQIELYALNIQTGQLHELRTDLPNIADNGSPDWGVDSWLIYFGIKKGVNIVYDPSLTRVAYPGIREQYPFYPVSLYDIQNDKELAVLDIASAGDAKWSPDGKYFSIIGSEESRLEQDIYIASRDGGQFTLLTNLAKLYPKLIFGSYSWSPDSQKIAFWIDADGVDNMEANDNSLILLDLATKQMVDLCIRGYGQNLPYNLNSSVSFMMHGQPVWSPDSKKLLVTSYDADVQKIVDFLIDLENNTAYQVAVDLEPIGWMK
jgi:Tol biopolymer transport system component